MSTKRPAYPQPQEDADNRPLLDGWRRGRLMLQRCRDCGNYVFYPRPVCPQCWSGELVWGEAAGEGTIASFSLVHRPNHPSFFDEAPIVAAEVLLTEGVPILARVVNVDPAAVRIGMSVVLLPPGAAERYPLPTFEPGPAEPRSAAVLEWSQRRWRATR